MERYFEFIREWVGIGFAFPLLYVVALFGPVVFFFLGDSRSEVLKNLGIFIAVCAFFAYFFLCLGTGIYFGKFHGLGGWGIPLGFVIFGVSMFGCVYLERLAKRARAFGRS